MPFPAEGLAGPEEITVAAARAIQLARNGDPRSGLVLVLRARSRAQALDLPSGEAEALNAAAIVHHMRRDPVAAAAAAIDARDLARRTGDRSLLGHARVTLAVSACNLETGIAVEDELLACVEDALDRDDEVLQVRARVALSVVLGDAGRFDEAQAHLECALGITCDGGAGTTPARILANLANLHRKRALAAHSEGDAAAVRRHGEATIAAARKACARAAAEGYLGARIDALAIEGGAHALLGDVDSARERLDESLAVARASRCGPFATWVLCELGRLELRCGNALAAREAFREALEHAREVRPSRKVIMACEGLSEAEALMGDHEAALRWGDRSLEETRLFHRARLETRHQLAVEAAA